MVDTVKDLFNKSTLGLFSSPDPEGSSEAELAAQTKRRRDEEEQQAELLRRGPSRIAGRRRKIGRQLLTFLGPTTTKSSTGRSTGREGRAFRGPGADRNRIR